MVLDPLTHQVTTIKVDGCKFVVIKEIHCPINLHGCETCVFIVKGKQDEKYYILKDSWILAFHTVSEIEQLTLIHNSLSHWMLRPASGSSIYV